MPKKTKEKQKEEEDFSVRFMDSDNEDIDEVQYKQPVSMN